MIHLDNIEHGQAIGDKVGNPFMPRVDRCVSRTRAGNLVGGVIYQNYTHRGINLHVAAWDSRWLTRDLLWTIFTYPFDMLKVTKVMAFVPTTNRRAIDFDKSIGFKEEYTIQDVVPGGGLMILSMRREDCRWLDWRPRYLETVAPQVREKGAIDG